MLLSFYLLPREPQCDSMGKGGAHHERFPDTVDSQCLAEIAKDGVCMAAQGFALLLDNRRAVEVHGLKLPVFLALPINRLRQPVKPKKVLILIHLREKGVFQLLILHHVDATLEDGLLYKLADS
jgi:hypothetical protein